MGTVHQSRDPAGGGKGSDYGGGSRGTVGHFRRGGRQLFYRRDAPRLGRHDAVLHATGSIRGTFGIECEAGDEAGAWETFNRYLLPVSRITAQGTGLFYAVHKEILRHRGVLRTATVRAPAPPMDALTRQELATLLAELYPDGSAIS